MCTLRKKAKIRPKGMHFLTQVILTSVFLLVLGACSSGGDPVPVDSQTLEPGDSVLSDPGAAESAVDIAGTEGVPFADSGADVFQLYPDIIDLQISESTQLRLAFTDLNQQTDSALPFVDRTWSEMQNCLGVAANPPLVILKTADVEPFSSSDDTIFNFEMHIAASAHDVDGASVIQILANDLDEQGESQGFYLRSILGRYLWRSNQLAERDYNYTCASSK